MILLKNPRTGRFLNLVLSISRRSDSWQSNATCDFFCHTLYIIAFTSIRTGLKYVLQMGANLTENDKNHEETLQ